MALDDDMDLLARQPLLGLMPREALRLVAFAAETRLLRAGDILFRQGEVADCGYIIMSGAVALDPRDDGSPAMEVATTGHLLGETALFAEVQRPATAVARETTTALRISRPVMARVLGEFPEAAALMHQALSQRMQQMSGQLHAVRERIVAIDG
jgi:CRP-like cAMP-binding protein